MWLSVLLVACAAPLPTPAATSSVHAGPAVARTADPAPAALPPTAPAPEPTRAPTVAPTEAPTPTATPPSPTPPKVDVAPTAEKVVLAAERNLELLRAGQLALSINPEYTHPTIRLSEKAGAEMFDVLVGAAAKGQFKELCGGDAKVLAEMIAKNGGKFPQPLLLPVKGPGKVPVAYETDDLAHPVPFEVDLSKGIEFRFVLNSAPEQAISYQDGPAQGFWVEMEEDGHLVVGLYTYNGVGVASSYCSKLGYIERLMQSKLFLGGDIQAWRNIVRSLGSSWASIARQTPVFVE